MSNYSYWLLFEIGSSPQFVFADEVKSSQKLAFMQQMVEGYIERVPIKLEADFEISKIVKNVWVNEEGIMRGLSQNLNGTIFVNQISSQKLYRLLTGNVLVELENVTDENRDEGNALARLVNDLF